MYMKNRTKVIIGFALAVALYVMYFRRESYDEKKEKKNVKEAAKDKKMSQKELDAVLKFIR